MLLEEVPLETANGFMRADVVLIRRNAKDIIDDVIIIENKLSLSTGYTPRQREGFGAILNGLKQMKVKYFVKGLRNDEDILNVSKESIFRLSDHGKDDVAGVVIEKITKL